MGPSASDFDRTSGGVEVRIILVQVSGDKGKDSKRVAIGDRGTAAAPIGMRIIMAAFRRRWVLALGVCGFAGVRVDGERG
jgi:hypothetical protein